MSRGVTTNSVDLACRAWPSSERSAENVADQFEGSFVLHDVTSVTDPVLANRRCSELAANAIEAYIRTEIERAANLSLGQRQLIAIARAVLADPRVLILDEATSNIDSQTELLVQQALGKLLAGRTSLVIAHRLSTIRAADEVLVLDAGRVIERGTHQELLRRRGYYFDLYQQQFAETLVPA